MKIHKLITLATIALCSVFVCGKANAKGISGYTSIDYDENSNTVDAYSETDLDGDLVGDYDAKVVLTVTDQNGSLVTSGSMEDTSLKVIVGGGYQGGQSYSTPANIHLNCN